MTQRGPVESAVKKRGRPAKSPFPAGDGHAQVLKFMREALPSVPPVVRIYQGLLHAWPRTSGLQAITKLRQLVLADAQYLRERHLRLRALCAQAQPAQLAHHAPSREGTQADTGLVAMPRVPVLPCGPTLPVEGTSAGEAGSPHVQGSEHLSVHELQRPLDIKVSRAFCGPAAAPPPTQPPSLPHACPTHRTSPHPPPSHATRRNGAHPNI